jgi:hypothetical protein
MRNTADVTGGGSDSCFIFSWTPLEIKHYARVYYVLCGVRDKIIEKPFSFTSRDVGKGD